MAHKGPHQVTHHGSDTRQDGDYVVVYETDVCWCGVEVARREVNRFKGKA